MRNWQLYNDTDHSTVYKAITDDSETSFIIDKELKCISYSEMYFVVNEGMWEPQQAEKDEWLKHSCKYGHWQADTILTLSEDDMQFMLDKFREHIAESEGENGSN